SFNVVHIRAMLQGVKNFHELFYHTHRMLRPGGVLLVLEPVPALFDANKDLIQARTPDDEGFTWFHWLSGMINQAIKARNPSYSDVERVLELLSEMGNDLWENVSGFSFFMPVGPWASDPIERQAGELMRNSVLRIATSVRPSLFSFGVSPQEVDRVSEGIEAEMKGGKVQQCLKVRQTAARRTRRISYGSLQPPIM
ncbi:hypothetical protein FRC00_005933, partial [Tulasnella sp. 408]